MTGQTFFCQMISLCQHQRPLLLTTVTFLLLQGSLLVTLVGEVGGEVITTEFRARSESWDISPPFVSHILASPGYSTPYKGNGDVHVYNITNTNKLGFIRINFLDLDLHPNSVLKIYDGANSSSKSYVYIWSDTPPVFQSKGPHMMVVFKPNKVETHAERYRGFYAHYHYVSISRSEWVFNHAPTVPNKGFCPRMSFVESSLVNHVRVQGKPSSWFGDPYLYDCAWSLRYDDTALVGNIIYIKIFNVSMKTGVASNRMFTLHENGYSDDPLVAFSSGLSSATGDPSHDNIYSTPFPYLRLLAPLKSADIVEFAYSREWGALQSYRFSNAPTTIGGDCPYKETSYGRCVNYWDTEDPSDGGCDSYEHNFGSKRCSNDKCYDPVRDICDKFDDCGDGTDENKESCEEVNLEWQGFVFFFFIIMVFFFGSWICRNCRDVVKDILKCKCCSSCSGFDVWRACSQCEECCNSLQDRAKSCCPGVAAFSGSVTREQPQSAPPTRTYPEHAYEVESDSTNGGSEQTTSEVWVSGVGLNQANNPWEPPPSYEDLPSATGDPPTGLPPQQDEVEPPPSAQPPSYDDVLAGRVLQPGHSVTSIPQEPPPSYESVI